MNWFRRRKDKEQEPLSPRPELPASAEKSLATLTLALPRQPDYSRLPSLQPVETAVPPPLAPLVVIGVGPVGQAVLESLSTWIPQADGGQPLLTLLSVRLAGEPSPDFRLPQAPGMSLTYQGRLELPFRHGSGNYPWYVIQPSDNWARPDGRLGLFQDLQNQSSALWDTLQSLLGDGRRPDVWLVSSVFDPVGSGMIFDLAHLVRLVGQAQNYVPFIGWMLALPGAEWGAEFQPETAGALRELTRLLCSDAPRIYEYSLSSTNYKLHHHESRGDEDANVVLLCEPPAEAYGHHAAETVVRRMALALLTLAQPDVWQQFRDRLRHLTQLRPVSDEALVGAFGVCAHYVPLTELQGLVRAWLARDILFSRQWGAVQPWRPAQVEPDEAAAVLLLQEARHDFLSALALAGRRSGQTRWPPAIGADQALALTLRQRLQELVDHPAPDNRLLVCDALLAGVEEVFLRAGAPVEQTEPLERVVAQARQELRHWLAWLRTANEMVEALVAAAQEQWERSLVQTGSHSVLNPEAARRTYESLLGGSSKIHQRIQEYVRWAWVEDEKSLRLCLDTLYPGYDPARPDWRHAPDVTTFPKLWEGAVSVVTALTREPGYWPSSLTAPNSVLPSAAEIQREAGLALAYDTGIAQAVHPTAKLAYQASGDRAWCEHAWLPAGVDVSQAGAFTSTLGLLLQVHLPIPLGAVHCLADLRRRYGSRRGFARTLHVFEPEQRAAEIEERGMVTLSRRQRDRVAATWLGSRTLAALQWPESMRLFVSAWQAGLVEPTFGPGPYRLLWSDSPAGPFQEMRSLSGNHPLEALHLFVPDNLRPAEQETLARLAREILSSREEQMPARLGAIANWWESSDRRDVEWYLIVHGMTARKPL